MAHSYVQDEDDVISYCGSMSGETFSARRRRNVGTLKQGSVAAIAQKLRSDSLFEDVVNNKIDDSTESPVRFNSTFHHFRFVIVMLGGLALGFMIMLRFNITVAILSMVNQTALYMDEHPNKTMDDFLAEGYSPGGEFDWNNEIQQMLMTWYMFAYTLPQLPLTKLSLVIGSRKAMPICLLICSLSTLITPCVSYWGWEWVLALRLVQGIGASAVLPLLLNVIEDWMPYEEMSLGLACAQLLQSTLSAANPLVAGYLSSIHWSYAFYVPGAVVFVFCFIWYAIVTDSPTQHWLISKKELDYIMSISNDTNLKVQGQSKDVKDGDQQQQETIDMGKQEQEVTLKRNPVWTDVFRIPSFYAFVFIWIFYCSSFVIFICTLPTYLRQFLKIEVSLNGFYCFVITTGSLLAVLWPHPVIKVFHEKLNLDTTGSRRLTYVITCTVTAATWIYVGCFHQHQLLMLFINRAFQQSADIVVTGTLMSNYSKAGISSLVFSMVNTVGNLSVTLGSGVVGYVLDQTGQSVEAWSWIYILLGLSQMVMLAVFCTLIKAEPIVFKHLIVRDEPNKFVVHTQQPSTELEDTSASRKSTSMNNFDDFRRATKKEAN